MVTQICVNIGSGNGLVPSGTKPLPEPMLTQIYFTIHQCWLFLGEILWHSPDCKFTWVSRIQYNEVENYTHISVAIKLNIWCNELHTYAYHKRFHFIQSTHTRYPIPPLWGWKWDFFSDFQVHILGFFITVMSHEHHGISNHQRLNCLFSRLFWPTWMKASTLSITDSFMKRIHWWPLDSPHKGSVMRKVLPCCATIITRPRALMYRTYYINGLI